MAKARINGININYRSEGRGEALVMIMGFSSNRRAWMFQIPVFKKRFRVITFDNRGAGKSEKPEGPYSTRVMAEDTVGLMDHLGIKKAHVLGVSMGGMIAQEVAINHPERVDKLVLVATYASRDNQSNGPTAEMRAAEKLPIKGMVSRLMSVASNGSLLMVVAGLLRRIPLALLGKSGMAGLIGQREACMGHDALERLDQISAPTLILAGGADRVIKPSSSDEMAKRIPNAKLTVFDQGSHVFCMEMKDRFNEEVLRFLEAG